VLYRAQAFAGLALRHLEPYPAGLDRRLRAADALRHRGLGDQEGRGDLRRGQSAHGAQRQRDLAGHGQRRMAAQEQQFQRVVTVGRLVGVRDRVRGTAEQLRLRRRGEDRVLAAAPRTVAAELVDQDAGRDRQQPGARALRDPVLGPVLRRLEQRLLGGVLAGVELAVAARERAEDLRRQLAQQVLDASPDSVRHRFGPGPQPSLADSCRIGQTSVGFWSAHGISAASS